MGIPSVCELGPEPQGTPQATFLAPIGSPSSHFSHSRRHSAQNFGADLARGVPPPQSQFFFGIFWHVFLGHVDFWVEKPWTIARHGDPFRSIFDVFGPRIGVPSPARTPLGPPKGLPEPKTYIFLTFLMAGARNLAFPYVFEGLSSKWVPIFRANVPNLRDYHQVLGFLEL